jgi:hypothetical protein
MTEWCGKSSASERICQSFTLLKSSFHISECLSFGNILLSFRSNYPKKFPSKFKLLIGLGVFLSVD